MEFSSLIFLFRFLPAVLLIYYGSPGHWKNAVLLASSLIFYSWGEIRFFPVMAAVILLNYASGLLLDRWDGRPLRRRLCLWLAVLGSLAFLFYFKYANFIVDTVNSLTGWALPYAAGIGTLPLGISFYTFQIMSYSVDVYRREVPAERNLVSFGAYVAMFPQLIAGPIVKYRDVAAQLRRGDRRVPPDAAQEGVCLFVTGLAEKVLLADGVGRLWSDITGVYSGGVLTTAGVGLANASTSLAWLGLTAYSLQLYFDFSGYSRMAMGLGRPLGFDFPENFRHPYLSRSITEFWRRWHITLGSWFREYVYIPLGGGRRGKGRQTGNLLVVWCLTGIWHGANWNFLLWGLYYFVLLSAEKLFLLSYLERGRVWPRVYTLFFVVTGWGLFVGNEPGVGLPVLFRQLFTCRGGAGAGFFLRNYGVLLLIAALCCTRLPQRLWERMGPRVRGAAVGVLFLLCVGYIVGASNSPFLYFNF